MYPRLGEGDVTAIVSAAGKTPRETRDGMIGEFTGGLRKRLLPEGVAAEEAQMERLYPPVSDPLPGLGDDSRGPADAGETTGQAP